MTRAVLAVGECLAEDDPLRIEVGHFAELFPRAKHDQKLLKSAGQQLWRAVERSTWPVLEPRADLVG